MSDCSTVRVNVPGSAYDVLVGGGQLKQAGSRIRSLTSASRAMIITDDVVQDLYGMHLSISLAQSGFLVDSLTVPAGEASKSWDMAGRLLEELAAQGFSRTDVIVALGGGVVGDLAGFVAAVYQRGVAFVQVPTTLLAMVDSSVGGKTAVDLEAGKNLAGAFKQPLVVIADTDVLAGLPEEEWLSGLAEVAKSAVIDGEGFLGWMEANAHALVARVPQVVREAVCRSVRFKAQVVARDETEEGPRECLNYGHTLGHALEKCLGYGTITHGAAVAEGIRFAARVSAEIVGAENDFIRRQDRLLDTLGLTPLDVRVEPQELSEAMKGDKKSREGVIRMVLADQPGSWKCVSIADESVSAHLEAWAVTKREGRA